MVVCHDEGDNPLIKPILRPLLWAMGERTAVDFVWVGQLFFVPHCILLLLVLFYFLA